MQQLTARPAMQAFLSLCQGNHFQFDTLRRAKHSSMMLLYHLHNPEAPAYLASCNVCNTEIEPGKGLRCKQCPDFDLCLDCYNRGAAKGHPADHQLQVGSALLMPLMRDVCEQAWQCQQVLPAWHATEPLRQGWAAAAAHVGWPM